jgi:hypothetical protein
MTGSIPAWAANIAKWAAISVGLGVIFAWFGVYETAKIPFPQRVGYWTLLIAFGAGWGLAIAPLVFEKWLAKSHPALPIALASGLISIPITIGIVAIEAVGNGAITPPAWWAQQYMYVLVVSVILTTGAWTLDRFNDQKTAAAAPAANAAPAGSAFADRLPAKFRLGTIYAVSAEDHYLRVHTSLGETMILMRLADAVRELTALEGQQTHRSWWVARQGLADVTRGDGRVTLKLKSGAEAPVSRTYQKAIKDAGWL